MSWDESGPDARARLLQVARSSVAHGLREGRALPVAIEDCEPGLRERGACFVTLRRGATLRGCTGSLKAVDPLVVDVANNAYRSAFRDPRFPPLESAELAGLSFHISILNPTEPLPVVSELDLLAQLRPGVDGLVLHEGSRSSTFLPAVWQSLPEPRRFVAELKRKAGLDGDHWSDRLRFERYTVEEVGEAD
jgi:AmmeMemoRadiSam system protein A